MKKPTIHIVAAAALALLVALPAPAEAQKRVRASFPKDSFATPEQRRKAKKEFKRGMRDFNAGRLGDMLEAVEHFKASLEAAPDNAAVAYYLGSAYLQSYPKREGLKHLQAAYAANPAIAPDILFKLGRGYHLDYQFGKARESYLGYRASLTPRALKREDAYLQKLVQETRSGEALVADPQRVFVDNVGDKVNTPYDDYSPVISIDGKTLYFTSKRPDAGRRRQKVYDRTGTYFENVYKASRSAAGWGDVERLPKTVNAGKNNAVVGIMPGGQGLVLFDGARAHGDLSLVKPKKNGKWTKPSKKPFKRVNSGSRESSASAHFDNKLLYFTSRKDKDSKGGSDVYESRRRSAKRKWGSPTNLGAMVNSVYDEESVFVSPDGQTLYFSSNGHNTMGGFDIFRCEVGSDGRWGEPQNLGYPINTPDDDMFFSITASQRFGYYATLAGDSARGGWDIYKVTFLGPEKPLVQSSEDMLMASLANPITETVIEKTVEIKTIRLTIVKGAIKDGFNEAPVDATIEVVDNERDEVILTASSDPGTGEYMISLPSGKNYGMMVKSPEYLFHSENFNIPAATNYQEISKDIMLNKLAVGSKVVLNNIFFESGKSVLHPSSYPELERVTTMMSAYKTLEIEISGHTDNVGSAASNVRLSETRAKAVVDYLIGKGVPAPRLKYKGYGFEQPVAPNNTEEGRALNRRVEFKILKK